MNYEEFAFANQQLAGLLNTGVPLEGALKQICATMRKGVLKQEFERLQADLAGGMPLEQAMARRRFPEFYIAMVRVGIQSNDLPAVLTLLADHYQKQQSILARLKGLMLYPVIVLALAFILSFSISIMLRRLIVEMGITQFGNFVSAGPLVMLWIPPLVLALAVTAVCLLLAVPAWRRNFRWRLPGFREASLAQVASSLSLMLARGAGLPEAVRLLREVEQNSPAARELATWESRLAQGQGKASAFASGGRVFPPLFVWLADNGGADLALGFKRAADIYHGRAIFKLELMLYACLPVSVLLLGMMIVGQTYPVVRIFKGLGAVLDSGMYFE